MSDIKTLHGITRIEIDKDNATLFLENSEGGVKVELGIHELMHLLDAFTDEEWTIAEIYGLPEDPENL